MGLHEPGRQVTNHSPPPSHVTAPSSLIGSDLAATVVHLQLLVGLLSSARPSPAWSCQVSHPHTTI